MWSALAEKAAKSSVKPPKVLLDEAIHYSVSHFFELPYVLTDIRAHDFWLIGPLKFEQVPFLVDVV